MFVGIPRNREPITTPRIPRNRVTAKEKSVRMNVTRRTRGRIQNHRGRRARVGEDICIRLQQSLGNGVGGQDSRRKKGVGTASWTPKPNFLTDSLSSGAKADAEKASYRSGEPLPPKIRRCTNHSLLAVCLPPLRKARKDGAPIFWWCLRDQNPSRVQPGEASVLHTLEYWVWRKLHR
jgi:hypothetical protein